MPELLDFSKRRAGILLHITSLPDAVGNGDLGT
jgi:4-alpha-glucanotransferase